MIYTVNHHLQNKEPVVSEIYDKLLDEIKKSGPVKVEPKKTSIHWVNRFAFAGIYVRKNFINLEFHLSRKLVSNRVSKVEQGSVNRFHHTIKLSDAKEIDKELLSWLKEAYELKA